MASAAAGLLLFATVGPHTAFFPTIFLACFAIGLGIGIAFMPLLTLAMADVPPADAGLGIRDHQRLPADQRRARTGRPQHRRRQPHEGAAVRRPRGDERAASAATTSPSSPERRSSAPGSSWRSRSCDRATRDRSLSSPRPRVTASPPDSPSRSKPHDRSTQNQDDLRGRRRVVHPRDLVTRHAAGAAGPLERPRRSAHDRAGEAAAALEDAPVEDDGVVAGGLSGGQSSSGRSGSSAWIACPNSGQASLRHSQSCSWPASASLAGWPHVGHRGGALTPRSVRFAPRRGKN